MPHSHPALARSLLAAGTAACLGLTNCSEMADSYHGKNIGMSGAGVVVDKPFEPYDAPALSTLIARSSPAAASGTIAGPTLEDTIGGFTQALYMGGAPDAVRQNQMRDARNTIQGALVDDSTNRCNAFKQILRARSTNTNFLLGSLSTGLAAAGAIVTGGASQALAGAAAAATGVGAEYNKDILSNVTSAVIIPGIDKQRSTILQEIINRRCLGVSSYNLTQAMADAIRYHAACSTDTGVAAAGSALSQTNGGTTSMAAASATLDAVGALSAKLHGQKDGVAAGGAAGATSPAPAAPAAPTVLLGSQIDYLQCPSLTADGMLSGSAVPAAVAGVASGDQVQYGAR